MISERENMLMLLSGETPQWVPNFGKSAVFVNSYACIRTHDPVTGYDIDRFGVKFQQETGALAGPMPVNTHTRKFELQEIEDWRKIFPKIDIGKVDWKTVTEQEFKKGQVLYGARSDQHIYNYVAGYLWDQMHYMMGFENALCALAEEPDACREMLDAMADLYIDVMTEQFKYCKPDLVMTMDHIANKDGLMMSPAAYRSIIKPAQKKIFDFVRDQGIMAEMHVDGNVNAIIADYAEIGVQAIQPFQVFNDIEKAKKDYGIICIGGWDAFGPGNAPGATEADVRASVRTAMDCYAPSGKYAIWFSGASATSKEKMFWLNDEAEKYGRTFYGM